MNYLPFCGYWFYGAISPVETAVYHSSYGLLSDAPEYTAPTFIGGMDTSMYLGNSPRVWD